MHPRVVRRKHRRARQHLQPFARVLLEEQRSQPRIEGRVVVQLDRRAEVQDRFVAAARRLCQRGQVRRGLRSDGRVLRRLPRGKVQLAGAGLVEMQGAEIAEQEQRLGVVGAQLHQPLQRRKKRRHPLGAQRLAGRRQERAARSRQLGNLLAERQQLRGAVLLLPLLLAIVDAPRGAGQPQHRLAGNFRLDPLRSRRGILPQRQ